MYPRATVAERARVRPGSGETPAQIPAGPRWHFVYSVLQRPGSFLPGVKPFGRKRRAYIFAGSRRFVRLWTSQVLFLCHGCIPPMKPIYSGKAILLISVDNITSILCLGAHGVVASHPLRMRKALGSNPSVSMLLFLTVQLPGAQVDSHNASA